ncbi:MAG: endo-alpha-N-acetylgalactosaminidase family protein [Planctomycetota bacterium]|nr:endo-alpha-N-acetylgalactosaminidase family protein [Planctomycetota bacterium]
MAKPAYRHQYHQAVTCKVLLGKKPGVIHCDLDQTLGIIRALERLTLGLEQIVYLVGWQYDGHDSKYPAFHEVNERLKRPGTLSARQSLLWLMREARAHNAFVSTHINLCDAYENSPLWEEYRRKDLLVREKDGLLQKGGVWDGEQSYRVSKAREWAAGRTQQRIDRFLELLPITDAGTVHIDAFFPKPSPYHGVTLEDEVKAIQAIMRYWRSRRVDVTGELFIHEYAGLMPLGWHLNLDEASRLKYPPSVVCGGGPAWNVRREKHADRAAWAGVFTAPEAGCLYEEAWGYSIDDDICNPGDVARFAERFFLRTVPWLHMNRHAIVRHVHSRDSYEVHLTGNLVSRVRVKDRQHSIVEDGRPIVNGDDLCVPAGWRKQTLIAYSKSGSSRRWELPPSWRGISRVKVTPLYPFDSRPPRDAKVTRRVISVRLDPGEAVTITPA